MKNCTLILLFLLFFLRIQVSFANETIKQCSLVLSRLAKMAPEKMNLVKHHGGVETLGGFTTLDTSATLTPKVGNALLIEYKKLETYDRSKKQLAYAISHLNERKERGPLADFIKAHRKLVTTILGDSWKWDASSLLLTSKDLQNCFHQHLSPEELENPEHTVSRANAVMSLRSPGTIFDSPLRDEQYPSLSGETSLFNEGAWHMSPPGAKQRFFLIHFFTKIKPKQH